MHAAHAILQCIILLVGVFLTFDSHLQPTHKSYELGFYLNSILLVITLLLDSVMTNSVGKRLVLWLLYYEIIAPLLFYFIFLVGAQSALSYVLRFFFFYLCLPLLYFSHLTLQSIAEFLQDTSYHVSEGEEAL